MDSFFKSFRLPRSLVGQSLLAAVSALLLVMALIGCAIATVLAVHTEPFSWEGPGSQEANIERALHFDAKGQLRFIEMSANLSEAYDALTKDMAFQVLDKNNAEVFTSPQGQALDILRSVPVHAVLHMTRTSEGLVPLQILTTPLECNGKIYLIRNARSERLASGIRSSGSAIFLAAAIITAILAVLVLSSIILCMARRATPWR